MDDLEPAFSWQKKNVTSHMRLEAHGLHRWPCNGQRKERSRSAVAGFQRGLYICCVTLRPANVGCKVPTKGDQW